MGGRSVSISMKLGCCLFTLYFGSTSRFIYSSINLLMPFRFRARRLLHSAHRYFRLQQFSPSLAIARSLRHEFLIATRHCFLHGDDLIVARRGVVFTPRSFASAVPSICLRLIAIIASSLDVSSSWCRRHRRHIVKREGLG